MKKLFIYHHLFVPFLIWIFLVGLAYSSEEKSIRSKTFYQYDLTSGSEEGPGTKISHFSYNKNGQVNEHLKFDQYGNIISKNINSYDLNERLSETVTEMPSMNTTKKMIYFYEDDKLIRADSYTNNQLSVIIEYQYNANGNVSKLISHSADNQVTFNTENIFDNDGNLVESFSKLNGNPVGNTSIQKSQQGSITKKMNKDGLLIQEVEKKLNKKGQLKEILYYDTEGRVTNRILNKYDEDKRVIEVINEVPSADIKTRKTRSYNEYGDMIEETHYNKLNNPVKKIRVEYDYFD